MTRTRTIYLVATTKLALSCFHKRTEGFVPMLNDNLGDRCHHELSDAVRAGLDIAESLDEKSSDIAIVHVTYSDEVHQELVASGDISDSKEKDFFGQPLFSLSAQAARRLNHEASFLMDVHPLPLYVKPKPANVVTGGSTLLN